MNIYNSKFVFTSTIFWVVLNLLGLYFLDDEHSRWLRVAASSYFILWSLSFHALNSKIHYVLLSFLICDVSLLFYENEIFNFITFIARSLTFFLLVWIVFPKIRAIKYNLLELFIGLFVISVNIYLLFELLAMVPEAHLYDYFVPAYLGFTILTMILVGAAITYNNRYSNKKSLYFLLAALFMALSDVNFFIAFYLEIPGFYYPDRFLHIFSLGLILLFWIKPLDMSTYNNIGNREV
ncbi:hypothetical protein LB465_08280 [Salegentibacter sp. LM13S]|uniref:hypothetical protein n=1 Tax=Salegentibacter lacus TaxID=2873599 RepID=UPI001CCCFC41|nr:hypothetical protein [Salegentibacter lacus]MBZ9630774.1 hypothetical protein [Salegentibacter lacus]